MFLAESLSFLERLGLGGMTALIGIAMVFLVLGILIGITNLLKLAVQNMPRFVKFVKSKFAIIANSKFIKFVKSMFAKLFSKNKKTIDKAIPSKKEKIISNITVSEENDEELAACITGAISYILATEQNIPTNQARARFIVKSIKRI